jgi:hypothetical protein
MITKKHSRRGGDGSKDLVIAITSAEVLTLLEKTSKQGLTSLSNDEKNKLTSYIGYLSNIKDKNGKSIMAEAIRDVTEEIKQTKPKTPQQISAIITEELHDTVDSPVKGSNRVKGGDTMTDDAFGDESDTAFEVSEGLSVRQVLSTIGIGAVLILGALSGYSIGQASSSLTSVRANVGAQQAIFNTKVAPFCIDYDPNYTPTYKFAGMLDVDPLKTASQELCISVRQDGIEEVKRATAEFYSLCGQYGVDPNSIKGPVLDFNPEDVRGYEPPVIVEPAKGNQTTTSDSEIPQWKEPLIPFKDKYKDPPRNIFQGIKGQPGLAMGGRKQKRKTKKRVVKRRVTRRKPTFSY